MTGAYRWKRTIEQIGAYRVPEWHNEWDPKATAECDHCEDAGVWINPDGDAEACPACGGKNRTPPKR